MGNVVEVDLATLDAFVSEMAEADRKSAWALVADAVAGKASLEGVLTGLQAPALVEAGRRWAAAEFGISESQAGATLVRAALGRTTPSIVNGPAFLVVGCPEGEGHELEAEMVADVWRSRGWPAQTVAGNMPARDLGILLNRRRPTALIVRCSTPCGLPGAARMIRAANEVGVPSVADGSGFGLDSVRSIRLGATAWATTIDAGIAVLEEWTNTPPPMLAPGSDNPVHQVFAGALPNIKAAASATLRRSKFRRHDDADDMASAIDGLDLLLQYIEAALLVDDQRVLLDYLTWTTAYGRDQEDSTSRLTTLLDAVAGEVPSTAPRANQFVQDGIRHLEWTSRAGSGRAAVGSAPPRAARRNGAIDNAPPMSNGPEKQQGQVFADLLFLAAVSCHAPMALISVIQPDGLWSTLSYGVDRRDALNEPDLFSMVAARPGPIELPDLAADPIQRSSKLANGPLAVRFVYGHPLRTSLGATLGVFCVLDRRSRQLTGPEHQAMSAIARQVTNQIVLWRRTTTPKADLVQTSHRRRSTDRVGGSRPGPDAALVDLLGLRRPGSGVEQHLLRSHEVAVLFDVTERTVINWAASRKLPSLRTAGGHLRFRSEDVVALLAGRTTPSTV